MKTTSKCTDAITVLVRSIYLRSICDRFASKRLMVSMYSNWCSFHGGSMQVPWRIDVELQAVSMLRYGGGASIYTCWFYHVLWLMQVPWRFHAGSMQVPCRFHAGPRELSWRLRTSKINQQTQHVTNMKPAWKLHGNSMKPASVRVQDRTALEFVSRKTFFSCFAFM